MKIQFDSSQQFQTSAVESIVGLFKGQSLSKGNFELSLEEGSLKFNYNHMIITKCLRKYRK
jgi:hypothetical protein